MSRRSATILWAAVAAAVLLLGGGVATFRRVLAGGSAGDSVALLLTVFGLVAAVLVAGRIVFVSARAQRGARRN